jgi:hypothetical protein
MIIHKMSDTDDEKKEGGLTLAEVEEAHAHMDEFFKCNETLNDDDDPYAPRLDVWDDVRELASVIHRCDPTQLHTVLAELSSEQEALANKFEEEFKGIPDSDPLKFEVMTLLGSLGIKLNKPIASDEAKEL